jgi:allene oxide cyclase
MRRTGTLIGLTTILVGVIAGFAFANLRSLDAPVTIHVVEHAATDKVIDIGAPGDSSGDLLTFHNILFDAKNDHRVGKDQGECVRIAPHQGTWECRWVAWINGKGSITVEGQFSDVHNTILAVTGGTGLYRNARGTMVLGFRDDPAEFDFFYRLVP